MDAFAVALAAGAVLRPLTFRPCFRLVFHFGLFQGLMTVIGWWIGAGLQSFVAVWSHLIAFALLFYIGGRMIYEAFGDEEQRAKLTDPSRGMHMIGLSVATSLDALAVGLSLALLNVKILIPALVIGVVASGFTVVGLYLGTRAGQRWGRGVEVAGGVILLSIGIKVLF